MNKTFCLSIALLSFMIIASHSYAGSWSTIRGYEISENDHNQVDLSIKAGGKIPIDGSSGAIGYGVVNGVNESGYPENVLALTSHQCVADSQVPGPAGNDCDNTVGLLNALFGIPNENHNDATWHAHFLDLKPATEEPCITVANTIGLEVDLVRTLNTGNTVSPDNKVIVAGSKISVSELSLDDFHNSAFNQVTVVSFGIAGFADENSTVTNLCLTSPPGQ